MLSVFLSHSSKDKPFVRELAEFLRREGDINVWLDEGEIAPAQNIVGAIDQGLDADFLILVLSPDSVQSAWVREEWMSALWQQTNNGTERLVTVLHRDCRIPNLLANKKLFDLRTNQPQGFREILTFLQTRRPVPPQRINQLPSRTPHFVGREPELASLREKLSEEGAVVPICEMAGRGKTALALEFAHLYQRDFESVYWLSCQSQNLAAIATDLMRQLGLELTVDLPDLIRELKRVCLQKRCLLILDNVDDESPSQLIPGGAASVLVTTRHPYLKFLRFHAHQPLPVFTEDQCFEFFRSVLGDTDVNENESGCKSLFGRFGYLPIGITVSAGLIRYDAHYTVASLAADPPRDVYALLSEAVDALDPAPHHLLAAMSACAPEGFALDLAAEIGGFDATASLDALQQLMSRSLVEELSRTGRRYRLHAMVREAACDESLLSLHARAVCLRFKDWEENWRYCEASVPDFDLTFERLLKKGATDLLTRMLANFGFRLMHRRGRFSEAFEICEKMKAAALSWNDKELFQGWLGNQSLILESWGQLSEALDLQTQALLICEELGDRDSQQRIYGNQSVILRELGRVDEALVAVQKQEEICRETGNLEGLKLSYGNQTSLLWMLGRAEDAFPLLSEIQRLCLESNDQNGLQLNYGNEAPIMRARGRPDEAAALYEKRETICRKLGNKSSLGYCYWNWGQFDYELGKHLAGRQKLLQALGLFKELQMPRERDAVAAELAKHQTASNA